MSLARTLMLASAPVLLLALGACATPFRADVSRFESQLPAPQGQSFAVVAEDPSLAGGLEFALYADYVEAELAKLGYTQAASPEEATLLVRFDYGIDAGRERIRSTGFFRDPFFGPWYGFNRPFLGGGRGMFLPGAAWGWGWQDPFFMGGGLGAGGISSTTIFTSGIDMKIDDNRTGQRLFEGKAQAVSPSNRLQYLVPNLVEAMFTNFPGNSGETVRISIKKEDQPVQR